MGESQPQIIPCVHCGQDCLEDTVLHNDLAFCCSGCKMVYEILNENNLQGFYEIKENEGEKNKFSFSQPKEFEYLDDPEVISKLVSFRSGGISKIQLLLPAIHCSACIWLLENLPKLHNGILESKVNYLKKLGTITFRDSDISLRQLAELLSKIGYKPKLNLADVEKDAAKDELKPLYINLGIAFFSFGNVMLFAFPEYLSGGAVEPDIKRFLTFLNLLFIPPLLFTAKDYFRSAFAGFKAKQINMDVPLSLGILVLALRSIWEITTETGFGYVDSFAGLMFFLTVGKIFKKKTFDSLSFSRDYKSYFPLSALKKNPSGEEYISVKNIKIGDEIIIRNNEIIPCDGVLNSGVALIDYSFVTGEAAPVAIRKNDKIFAGGKQIGSAIEILITKQYNQSYLTELWNNSAVKRDRESYISELSLVVSKYFTIIAASIAIGSFIYWYGNDPSIAWNAFTATLIIVCPCALSMSIPFSYGTTIRQFAKNSFFLKNEGVVERLARSTAIIFDKTGTLTSTEKVSVKYEGKQIDDSSISTIKSATRNSSHPLSKAITASFSDVRTVNLSHFEEIPGKGLIANYGGLDIKLGSKSWVMKAKNITEQIGVETAVHLEINGEYFGAFSLESKYRDDISGLANIINRKTALISGDNSHEEKFLKSVFGNETEMKFNCLPKDKLDYIENLNKKGERTVMLGDGLNDAGAILASDVGIAVAENASNFTPGSDAILLADEISKLPKFIKLAEKALSTVKISYALSFAYNIIGLIFAVSGNLSPVVAAILMPFSSISVIIFTSGKVNFDARMLGLFGSKNGKVS